MEFEITVVILRSGSAVRLKLNMRELGMKGLLKLAVHVKILTLSLPDKRLLEFIIGTRTSVDKYHFISSINHFNISLS